MKTDMQRISGIEGGHFIYSMWEGYRKKVETKEFLKYFESRNFSIHSIHTSGHADIDTLKLMVESIDPKTIIPIHTFNASDYSKIFKRSVIELKDGETVLTFNKP
jgi:ribonuclease J